MTRGPRVATKVVLRRFVHALGPGRLKSTEGLSNAINAALVHAGVRHAARLDMGSQPTLLPSLRRNKLAVVDWAGGSYEPLVVRSDDADALALCDRLLRRGNKDALLGRLLGYACDLPTNAKPSWMVNFAVHVRPVVVGGARRRSEYNWLAGFRCSNRAHTRGDMDRLLERYAALWVDPADAALAGTTVTTQSGQSFTIERFSVGVAVPVPPATR